MKGSAPRAGLDVAGCSAPFSAVAGTVVPGILALMLLTLRPLPVRAQDAPPPARSTHGRAHADQDLLLRLDSVVLLVPVGAVAPGAVVGLGVGGVPDAAGVLRGTGVIVTAAGGLHGDAAILLAPSAADRAVIAAEGGTAALVDTATGGRRACLGAGARVACPVGRPSAYVVGGVSGPPPSDELLTAALTRIPSTSGARRLPVWGLLLVVAAAAGLGAAGALLLGGRPRSA